MKSFNVETGFPVIFIRKFWPGILPKTGLKYFLTFKMQVRELVTMWMDASVIFRCKVVWFFTKRLFYHFRISVRDGWKNIFHNIFWICYVTYILWLLPSDVSNEMLQKLIFEMRWCNMNVVYYKCKQMYGAFQNRLCFLHFSNLK